MSITVNRWVVLAAVVLSNLPIVLDMTILHIAVPTLSMELQASGTEVLWIIDIYSILMAGLLVPAGVLSDRVGHRRMMLIGLVIFGLASGVAAYAPSAPALIAARALLAVGAAIIMPCVLAIIRQTFHNVRELSLAIGVWGTVHAAGAALGPLVGGALLEHFWWGSVFLINVPIMLLVWPIAWLVLPRRHVKAEGPWALGQSLLLIAAIIALVFSIKTGVGAGTLTLPVVAALVLGMIMLGLFVRQQLTSATPMLDLSLFSKPAIVAGLVMAMVVSGALAGVEFTIAQELQYVIGRTPLQAALFMLPLMASATVGGPLAGVIVARVGLRGVASASMLVSAIGLAGLGLSDFHHTGPGVILSLMALGLALSVGLTASSVAIMSSVDANRAGAAGALESTGYELGAGVGITLFGVLVSIIFTSAIHYRLADPSQCLRCSISDTFILAQHLDEGPKQVLLDSARTAFSAAHVTVLMSAAAAFALLALYVFLALRHYQPVQASA